MTALASSIIIILNRQYRSKKQEMPVKEKFAADSMLGRLAKWLRVLGYDTVYLGTYGPGVIKQIIAEGRLFLSRRKGTEKVYSNTILIDAVCVGDQLAELKEKVNLTSDRSEWFSRCLICNTLLRDAATDDALNNVPEYVFHNNLSEIRLCPLCVKYYWQGSHRKRMIRQLEEWGFS
jgi:uncharacterized protein